MTKFSNAINKVKEKSPDMGDAVLPPAMVPGRVLHIDGDY